VPVGRTAGLSGPCPLHRPRRPLLLGRVRAGRPSGEGWGALPRPCRRARGPWRREGAGSRGGRSLIWGGVTEGQQRLLFFWWYNAVWLGLVDLFFKICLVVFRCSIAEIRLECEGDRVKALPLGLGKSSAAVFCGKIFKVPDLQKPTSNCLVSR